VSGIAQRSTLSLWNLNNGALAAAGVLTSGSAALHQFLNGFVRGNLWTDAAGTLTILQERVQGAGGATITVPVDATVTPNFQYPFFVAVFQPFVTFTWTNGAGAATFVRTYVTATPLS
jgi:hypothetical protein